MAKLTDVKIKFISLVDKAANKKRFAIVKSENGGIELDTFILKQNEDKKLVTCVVYEPNTKDTHGDYMSEEDIEKAAHDFLINGKGADIQHDNQKADVDIVESWVAKTDTVLGNQEIKKGTWVATMKINDDLIWKAIKDGRLTGFSMGGTAIKKSEERGDEEMSVTIEEIKKAMAEILEKEAKTEDVEALKKKIAELEKEKETVQKQADEIANLKTLIEKMDEEIKKAATPTATNPEVEIAKAEEEYADHIRKATLTTGAALVPKPLSSQMVKDMKEIAPFFKDGSVISAKGTTIRVPVRKPTTSTTAKSKTEKTATAEGEVNFGEVEISKSVIQAVIPITDELRRDSQFDIVALVKEYGIEDIGEQIALRTYNGTVAGDQKIEGFTKDTEFSSRAVEETTQGKLTWDELMKIKAEVKPQYYSGAKWYVSKAAYLEMKLLKDGQGRPLWVESLVPGAPPTFDGHPVVLCWQMDAEFPVLFANFKKLYMYFVDYQMESEMERNGKAGYTDEILRARLGGKVVNPQAGYMIKKKSS